MLQSILAQRKTVKALLFHTFLVIWPALLIPASATAGPPAGQWQEKTESIWDGGEGRLVRRSFRVLDQHPELGLEFYWLPETESGNQTGAINGAGELIWCRKGASPYDRASRYSTYKGTLKDGLPDGWGTLSVRSGLTYEGAWKSGRMHGFGSIEYETGERYQGNFVEGEPAGRCVASNDQIVDCGARKSKTSSAAAAGRPSLLGPSLTLGRVKSGQPEEVAQVSGPITMNLYIDRAKSNEFKESGGELESFVYNQTDASGTVEIRLDAPNIMARWKGDGTITADGEAFTLDPDQFGPVFLVVDIVNDGDRAAQIVGGYIDVAESATDREPYLEIASIEYFAVAAKLDPTFAFLNEGWGPVQNARITYYFGKEPGGQTFVIDAGTFDQSKEVSTLPGFLASGLNVSGVTDGHFPCASEDEIPNCLATLVQSGLFGQLGGAMFTEYTHVYTQVSGMIDYGWTDSQGRPQQRQSPISVKLPVLDFVIGPVAEYGAPEAVNRKLPAITLALDQQNYRIPFSYRARLGAQENKRFALTLDAEKSSHHVFRIVLQLADGSTVSTAPIDLLMFKPRAVQLY
jgi:hypothetical protein